VLLTKKNSSSAYSPLTWIQWVWNHWSGCGTCFLRATTARLRTVSLPGSFAAKEPS